MPDTIPILTETEVQSGTTLSTQTQKQQERAKRIFDRLDQMLEHKRPYEQKIRQGLLAYDGISTTFENEAHAFVVPFARIFCDTKTAEEYSAMTEFEFLPVDDDEDVWKVELLREITEHIRRKLKSRALKLRLIRMKNAAGVAIKRKGYRLVMRTIKEGVTYDEFGRMETWKDVEVPIYDDIYEEMVDPLDFVIDPNATSINDAVDCGQFHRMNWEDAYEMFGKDPRFDFKGVKPGLNNMVEFYEHFNVNRDEWVLYAWSSTGTHAERANMQRPAVCKEVYFGPLPDDHKMLPYISYHCDVAYTTGYFDKILGRSNTTGEEASSTENVVGRETFWTQGIPVTMADLTDYATAIDKQLLEAVRLAATHVVATKDNFRINNRKKWKSGEQIVGGMGKLELLNFAAPNLSAMEYVLTRYFELMVLLTGVDPRNLTDSKQKTATEDIAQRESSAKRINTGIEFNEDIAETRDGLITHKLIQQHYTRMEVVRLTGEESEKELERFDETMGEHPKTGKPLVGKRYRRIRASRPMSEISRGTKRMLKKEHRGKFGFPSRPEYIRVSEVDIATVPKRRAGEVQALLKQEAREDLELLAQLVPLTQPSADGSAPSISLDDMPNVRSMVERWILSRGGNPIRDIGQNKKDPKDKKLDDAVTNYRSKRKPINELPAKTDAIT